MKLSWKRNSPRRVIVNWHRFTFVFAKPSSFRGDVLSYVQILDCYITSYFGRLNRGWIDFCLESISLSSFIRNRSVLLSSNRNRTHSYLTDVLAFIIRYCRVVITIVFNNHPDLTIQNINYVWCSNYGELFPLRTPGSHTPSESQMKTQLHRQPTSSYICGSNLAFRLAECQSGTPSALHLVWISRGKLTAESLSAVTMTNRFITPLRSISTKCWLLLAHCVWVCVYVYTDICYLGCKCLSKAQSSIYLEIPQNDSRWESGGSQMKFLHFSPLWITRCQR